VSLLAGGGMHLEDVRFRFGRHPRAVVFHEHRHGFILQAARQRDDRASQQRQCPLRVLLWSFRELSEPDRLPVPIERRRKPSEATMAKRGFLRESKRPGTDPPRGLVGLQRTPGEMASTASATSEQPTRIPDGPLLLGLLRMKNPDSQGFGVIFSEGRFAAFCPR
jgi:hypothetical protein